jgi:Ca2+-binding EF-hand superfamily protein
MGSNSSQIDAHVYQSIAKYTTLTHEDIQAWQEYFFRYCHTNATTMNKEEFCQFYQQIRPNENVKRLSENIFRAFDLNGDHGISFSEVS